MASRARELTEAERRLMREHAITAHRAKAIHWRARQPPRQLTKPERQEIQQRLYQGRKAPSLEPPAERADVSTAFVTAAAMFYASCVPDAPPPVEPEELPEEELPEEEPVDESAASEVAVPDDAELALIELRAVMAENMQRISTVFNKSVERFQRSRASNPAVANTSNPAVAKAAAPQQAAAPRASGRSLLCLT